MQSNHAHEQCMGKKKEWVAHDERLVVQTANICFRSFQHPYIKPSSYHLFILFLSYGSSNSQNTSLTVVSKSSTKNEHKIDLN